MKDHLESSRVDTLAGRNISRLPLGVMICRRTLECKCLSHSKNFKARALTSRGLESLFVSDGWKLNQMYANAKSNKKKK